MNQRESDNTPYRIDDKVRLFASKGNWIDGEALEQLKAMARLPGVLLAVGLADLHPGRGIPVGAAFLCQGILYPHLIGNDIGCGMGLWKTGLKRHKCKPDRWAKRLAGLESPGEGDTVSYLAQLGIHQGDHDVCLGTIGGGNHFAELQCLDKVQDQEAFDRLGLDEQDVFVLIHSGSRGLGDSILRRYVGDAGAKGLGEGSEVASQYLQEHDHAVRWAAANRALIARRLCDQIHTECVKVLDVPHNGIWARVMEGPTVWLHRKGAAPADQGPVIVPGTRGSLSYLVLPLPDQDRSAWSVAHGAGRRWNRRSARARLGDRYRAESLARTDLGSYVICEDKDLLFEEAPQAYKDIDAVIQDMVQAGQVRVIASLRPLLTYKTRRTE